MTPRVVMTLWTKRTCSRRGGRMGRAGVLISRMRRMRPCLPARGRALQDLAPATPAAAGGPAGPGRQRQRQRGQELGQGRGQGQLQGRRAGGGRWQVGWGAVLWTAGWGSAPRAWLLLLLQLRLRLLTGPTLHRSLHRSCFREGAPSLTAVPRRRGPLSSSRQQPRPRAAHMCLSRSCSGSCCRGARPPAGPHHNQVRGLGRRHQGQQPQSQQLETAVLGAPCARAPCGAPLLQPQLPHRRGIHAPSSKAHRPQVRLARMEAWELPLGRVQRVRRGHQGQGQAQSQGVGSCGRTSTPPGAQRSWQCSARRCRTCAAGWSSSCPRTGLLTCRGCASCRVRARGARAHGGAMGERGQAGCSTAGQKLGMHQRGKCHAYPCLRSCSMIIIATCLSCTRRPRRLRQEHDRAGVGCGAGV